jgi:hypothetical protein
MKDRKPNWKKAERFNRVGRFTVKGSRKDLFPLLCPVLEYDWLPDWKCTMRWSESGVAEKDAIFTTREAFHRSAVWTAITYEPDDFIEYLVVSGTDEVVRLSIRLSETAPGAVDVTWTMLFTALSALGAHVVGRSFSEAGFKAMMENRRRELTAFLQKAR